MVTGQSIGEGFRIEKVLFESFPDHHVTALLYLPHGSANLGVGPWPGILFACGHSANGKAYASYQKACALLAQHGFVVLSYTLFHKENVHNFLQLLAMVQLLIHY